MALSFCPAWDSIPEVLACWQARVTICAEVSGMAIHQGFEARDVGLPLLQPFAVALDRHLHVDGGLLLLRGHLVRVPLAAFAVCLPARPYQLLEVCLLNGERLGIALV